MQNIPPPVDFMPADGLAPRARALATFTVLLATMVASMSVSIVNVALPTIAQALEITDRQSVLLIASFQVAMVAGLIPLSALGEIIGYRRIYLPGLALFALASVMVARSQGFWDATFWRLLHGLGTAGVLSVNSTLLRFIYPRHLFGRALGLNAFVAGSAMAGAPLVASVILASADWHWLFLINVPTSAVALLLGAKVMPQTPRGRHRLAPRSIALHVVSSASLLGALNLLAMGGSVPFAMLLLVVGGASGWLYLADGRRRQVPLFPSDLFRIPAFRLSVAASVCSFAAQILMLTFLPFYFERVTGRSPSDIGVLLGPWPLAVMAMGLSSGYLSDRIPAERIGLAGMLLFAAGLGSFGFLTAESSALQIICSMIVCGLGFGLFQTPNNRMMLSSAPPERAGAASGTLGTARLVGQSGGSLVAALALAHDPGAALPWVAAASVFCVLFAAAAGVLRLHP